MYAAMVPAAREGSELQMSCSSLTKSSVPTLVLACRVQRLLNLVSLVQCRYFAEVIHDISLCSQHALSTAEGAFYNTC